ncbi:MAG TPA: tripartite tricarboxylate transporter substrate binding protein [Burkholderiales bacterium]|nr:tripartite tricarboxylate transporter substrate binding protein [Burkholderiales bacterium]
MKANSWRTLVVLGLLAGSLPAANSAEKKAQAGDFPNKPIRFIVPFPPGGSNDVLSRYLGIKLTDRLGQQIVIDNRAGANGIIGTDLASHAPADGYTILIASTSYVMNAAVRKLPYDVEKSFDPVSFIAQAPNCIVVNPKGGFATLRDLVERARAKPASIFYASTGIGGFNHFGGELFKKIAKVDMVMVPYKGGGPAMTDVIAGQIPVMFSSVTQALPHIRNHRLKALAVGASKRTSALPDVPTVIEAGFPGYTHYVWWGIVAPHGVPARIQNKLRSELNAILQDPETTKRLQMDAAEPRTISPAEFRKMIHNDVKKWTDVARTAGIHVQ